VRLAQRVSVRIRLDEVPENVWLVAGSHVKWCVTMSPHTDHLGS
jgi:hypothetical protein